MKVLGLAIAAAALMAMASGTAHAQRYTNYPYCAVYDFWTVTCSFNSMAQCLATVSGRRGYCERNPQYRPAQRSRPQRSR